MADSAHLGKIHVITGPGKGKTTAAFGLAMRATGHGFRVCIVQFMKSENHSGEVLSSAKLGNIEVHQFGSGRFVNHDNPSEEDREIASEALSYAARALASGEYQMVVLDEVNVAASISLVEVAAVLRALTDRFAGVEVVLTGRNAPEEFIELADYVSEIADRKHPYNSGVKAREGVEW